MKIITFLSDFGLKDAYVSQMKGVACDLSDARLVDITHEISPHDINEGAFVLRSVVPFFPIGSVHVAVVDPGVGTRRRNIIVVTRKNVLVGPDNGLLIPAARFFGDFDIYEITNKKYMNSSISKTFHGRDIYTPVAAYITNGVSFDEFGDKINDFTDLDFGNGKLEGNKIIGRVIYNDRFGNIITNISGDLLKNNSTYGKSVKLSIGSKNLIVNFEASYGYVKEKEILLTIGSSNYVEIGMNQGNAAKKLSVKKDDNIKIMDF